jgi:hypothetical protein
MGGLTLADPARSTNLIFVVSALCADFFKPQARRYDELALNFPHGRT